MGVFSTRGGGGGEEERSIDSALVLDLTHDLKQMLLARTPATARKLTFPVGREDFLGDFRSSIFYLFKGNCIFLQGSVRTIGPHRSWALNVGPTLGARWLKAWDSLHSYEAPGKDDPTILQPLKHLKHLTELREATPVLSGHKTP